MSTTQTRAEGATSTRGRRAARPPMETRPMVRNRTAVSLFLGYVVLVAFSFVYLYPFLIQLTTSFKTNSDAVANPLSLVADPFTTAAFDRLFATEVGLID